MIFFVIFLSLIPNLSAIPVELKDGTKIEGEVQGFIDDSYAIKTKYGILTIKKEDILNAQDLEIEQEKISNNEENISSDTVSNNHIEETLTFEVINSSGEIKKIYYENSIAIATRTYSQNNVLISQDGNIKDGTYTQRYSSGNIKAQLQFENEKENGLAKFFYENGNMQARAQYKNGLLDGTLFSYSPEGILLSEQNYKEGLLDGSFCEYNIDGSIKSKTFYLKGEKIEPQKETPQNKKIAEEEPLSAKKIKVARGYRFIVYLEKKYKASFTILNNGVELKNRREGELPDGQLKVYSEDGQLTDEFVFKNNSILRYSKISNGKTEIFDFSE